MSEESPRGRLDYNGDGVWEVRIGGSGVGFIRIADDGTIVDVDNDQGAEGSGGKCACGYIHFLCKRFTQAGCPDTETTEGLVRDPKLTREEAGALIADADYGFRWLPAEHFGHVGSARAKLSAALATEGEGDE